jgi:hypothetical protein
MKSYFKVAIENIEKRFDVSISNIKELKNDTTSIGALGYLIEDKIYLISPVRSAFSKENIPNGKQIGELVEIEGNYQDIRYSNIKKLNLPAIVINQNKMYFNAQPFTNFQ